MSRSCWALAEIRRRGAFVHVAGERRRFDGRLRRGPRPLPSAVSATKYAAVLVAAAGEPRLTLKQKLALFDPERHGGEAMATVRIGNEVL